MHFEGGGNIGDYVAFNNLSYLDVFTRQYLGTFSKGENRDDSMSVIDEKEEINSTNASTDLFALRSSMT